MTEKVIIAELSTMKNIRKVNIEDNFDFMTNDHSSIFEVSSLPNGFLHECLSIEHILISTIVMGDDSFWSEPQRVEDYLDPPIDSNSANMVLSN